MQLCRFVRSVCPAVFVVFGVAASLVSVPKAYAQGAASWGFAGAYTEDPYYEYQFYTNMGYSSPNNAGSFAGASSTGLQFSASGSSAGSAAGESVSRYDSASYIYYPQFAWNGTQAGNPNHAITSASVSAAGEGTSFGSGQYTFSLTTPNDHWRDGGSSSASGDETSSAVSGVSPDFYLAVIPVSDNLSFSTDWIDHSAATSAYTYSPERGYAESEAAATASVLVTFSITND